MVARKHASHPPYDVMVTEAVIGLKDRSAKGSSLFALKKHIEAQYEVPTGYSRHVNASLTKLTTDGTLLRTGNSYKLTPEGRKRAKAGDHKARRSKSSSSTDDDEDVPKRAPVKKAKPTPKKTAPKKAAPKKPAGVIKKGGAKTAAQKKSAKKRA
jgi:hypothetical protein